MFAIQCMINDRCIFFCNLHQALNYSDHIALVEGSEWWAIEKTCPVQLQAQRRPSFRSIYQAWMHCHERVKGQDKNHRHTICTKSSRSKFRSKQMSSKRVLNRCPSNQYETPTNQTDIQASQSSDFIIPAPIKKKLSSYKINEFGLIYEKITPSTYIPLRIHGTGMFTFTRMVDLYGFHVGKYTIVPWESVMGPTNSLSKVLRWQRGHWW